MNFNKYGWATYIALYISCMIVQVNSRFLFINRNRLFSFSSFANLKSLAQLTVLSQLQGVRSQVSVTRSLITASIIMTGWLNGVHKIYNNDRETVFLTKKLFFQATRRTMTPWSSDLPPCPASSSCFSSESSTWSTRCGAPPGTPSRGTSTRSTASTTRERRQRLKALDPTVWTSRLSMTTWGKAPCSHIAILASPLSFKTQSKQF